ncbi:MAG: hypothetical protein JOZ81_18935 [Chloroflexi bacterium]|nr:hypothetical protein [Chloroflexota bacterium]
MHTSSELLNRGARTIVAGVLLLALLAGAVVSTTPTRADNAPMQPTTAGLVPGVPGTTVRMAAEKVDIHVVERDNAIHALVTASFDMFNPRADSFGYHRIPEIHWDVRGARRIRWIRCGGFFQFSGIKG